MEILKKHSAIELIFYGLATIFVVTLLTIVILNELGYIKTSSDDCQKLCAEFNQTAQYVNDKCRCCTHTVKSNKMETIIEDRCYEVFNLNETKT
jgi:hypothetical protein